MTRSRFKALLLPGALVATGTALLLWLPERLATPFLLGAFLSWIPYTAVFGGLTDAQMQWPRRLAVAWQVAWQVAWLWIGRAS